MIKVRTPATSANLGAGFDCLALALGMWNDLTLSESEQLAITCSGQGERELPLTRSNLAYRAIERYYHSIGKPLPSIRLHLTNAVPLSRGLGSSATAVVGGLAAANALAGGRLASDELLRLATEMEGHPDNVAAALLGGLVVSVVADGEIRYARMAVPDDVRAVVFIPDFVMSTRQARAVLPEQVSRQDAVFNLSRAALMVAAFAERRYDLLSVGTGDRLHQPYRQRMFPAMSSFFAAAREAGALGAYLSGAGSTILALAQSGEDQIASAMTEVSQREGIGGRAIVLDLVNCGTEVVVD